MRQPTVAEYFSRDHDRLDGLFHQFQRLGRSDPPRAKAAFREFEAGLLRHIRWEEEVLFPVFDDKTGHWETGPTKVMRREHELIREALREMSERAGRGELDGGPAARRLLDVLGEHNRKEESVLYPTMDGFLDAEELGEVHRAIEEITAGERGGARAAG